MAAPASSSEVSNSSGTTSSAPRRYSASTSLTYRVRTTIVRPGAARRATATICRVADGSAIATTSTRARAIPAWANTSGLEASP